MTHKSPRMSLTYDNSQPHTLGRIYMFYDDDEESKKLAAEISNSLKIDSDNPFDRIELWKTINEDLAAILKERIGVEDKIIKPAIDGWDENNMRFLVRDPYDQIGPYTICNIETAYGIFYFEDQDKLNSEEGCIYCGEYIPKKYMHLILFN